MHVPSVDAVVSQRHWQPSAKHRLLLLLGTFAPKANTVDFPLHISAHSTSVEKRPAFISDPSHSFWYATRLRLSINIPKIDRKLHYTYDIIGV